VSPGTGGIRGSDPVSTFFRWRVPSLLTGFSFRESFAVIIYPVRTIKAATPTKKAPSKFRDMRTRGGGPYPLKLLNKRFLKAVKHCTAHH
jgi:hypothetical protein